MHNQNKYGMKIRRERGAYTYPNCTRRCIRNALRNQQIALIYLWSLDLWPSSLAHYTFDLNITDFQILHQLTATPTTSTNTFTSYSFFFVSMTVLYLHYYICLVNVLFLYYSTFCSIKHAMPWHCCMPYSLD